MRRAVAWLALIASLAGGAWYAWRYWPAQRTYRLGVRLPDPGELAVGAHVRRGGLTIGYVAGIDDEGGPAVAWLDIGEHHVIAAAAKIDVATTPVLGTYVRVRQPLRARARAAPGTVLEGASSAPPSGLARTISDLQAAAAAAREASQAAARLLTAPAASAALMDLQRASAGAAAATSEALELAHELRGVAADVARLARAYGPEGPAGRELAATATRIASAAGDVAAVTGRVRAAAEDPRLAQLGEEVLAAAGSTARAARRARDWWDRLDLGGRSSTLYDLGGERIVSDLAIWGSIDGRTRAELGWQTGPAGGLTARAGRRLGGELELRTGTLAGEPSIGVAADGGSVELDLRGLPSPRPRFTLRAPVSGRWSAELRAEPEGLMVGAASRW